MDMPIATPYLKSQGKPARYRYVSLPLTRFTHREQGDDTHTLLLTLASLHVLYPANPTVPKAEPTPIPTCKRKRIKNKDAAHNATTNTELPRFGHSMRGDDHGAEPGLPGATPPVS